MVIQGKPTFIFTNVKWLGHVNIVVELRLPLHLAIANVVGHCRNFCEVKIVGRERNPKVDPHQKGKRWLRKRSDLSTAVAFECQLVALGATILISFAFVFARYRWLWLHLNLFHFTYEHNYHFITHVWSIEKVTYDDFVLQQLADIYTVLYT